MTTENNNGEAAPAAADNATAGAEGGDNNASLMNGGDNQTPSADNKNDAGNTETPPNEPTGDEKNQNEADAAEDGKDQDSQESETPTEYEEFKMPDGFEVNEEVMGEFKGMLDEVGKDLGKPLSQEQAQKFVDMGGKLVQEGVEMAMQNAADFHAKRTQEWIEQFQKDPDVGGTEENQKESLAAAKSVALALGGDDLLHAIDETGAGNHLAFIKAFHKLRDIVGEDGKLVIANQGGGETNLAKRLYPDQQT